MPWSAQKSIRSNRVIFFAGSFSMKYFRNEYPTRLSLKCDLPLRWIGSMALALPGASRPNPPRARLAWNEVLRKSRRFVIGFINSKRVNTKRGARKQKSGLPAPPKSGGLGLRFGG